MKCIFTLSILACLFVSTAVANEEDGFVSLFDGESLAGWKVSEENPDSFFIEDGAIVAHGPRAHLFYDGDLAPFRNFELKVDVWAERFSNGGIYFHTEYQASGWPKGGFESQVNVSHKDWRKTGSIYAVASVGFSPVQDRTWWTQHIIVEGNKVTVRVNGVIVVEYIEPDGAVAGADFERVLDEGTIGLQGHDPDSVIRYKNIRIKRLPDTE